MFKTSAIGGQAVVEGVMMRAPERLAIAVRKDDGSISVRVRPNAVRPKGFLTWPIVRGVVNFIDMLRLSMTTMNDAAEMLGVEEEEPDKFSQWLSDKTGKSVDDIVIAVAMVLGIALAVGLFFILPTLLTQPLAHRASPIVRSLCTGLVRLIIFAVYLWLVAYIKDIQRVFMYHGAEHKTIFAYENELELTVENARTQPRLHPRCGTSFLLIVMIVSIIVFSVLRSDRLWIQIVGRLALLPVVTGISYELLKYFAKHDNCFCRVMRWPGMQLQRLTTREPDDGMLEVAIAAFRAAAGEEVPEEYREDRQKDTADEPRDEAEETAAEDAEPMPECGETGEEQGEKRIEENAEENEGGLEHDEA